MSAARRLTLTAAGAAALLIPVPAHAHLVTTGLGPVYDGVSHLFVSFEDLLSVLALAALGGLNGRRTARGVVFVGPAAWLAAGLAGYHAGASAPTWLPSVSLLALGLATAAAVRVGPAGMIGLSAAVGAAHGWLNGAGLALDGREASGLVGIVGAVFVVATLIAALVVALEAAWARVAVRVAGSWIGAIGLLSAGWFLKAG